MKFMAEKPYYPIPLPSIASIGTVLSIKPMRVSEAWRFTPVYSNEASYNSLVTYLFPLYR